jgi:Fe-S oxidoreductase
MAMTETFESALQGRVDAMIDACTRCGKCVEVCPATEPAGLSAEQRQNPAEVIGGVIDLLRGSAGNDSARKWASGCLLSGECIKACDYGVNPRFLLGMARVAMAKSKDDAATQRRAGVEGFREVARGVNALSRLQLDDALLARLGQVPKQNAPGELPDFVFYTGCNVLKTPHIALMALDVMDALGISYEVMGGPTHCCGVQQLRAGDLMTFGRVAESTLDKLARSKTGEVLSWCPSCQVQFTEMTLPTVEKTRGAKPFDMTPFTLFLRRRRTLQEQELLAAEAAGVDALVAVYHSDHRELCAHERDWPFRIMNFLEIVGASMALHHDDHFKRLKMLQDADAILADCRDLVEQHGLDVETTRQAIKAMLDEQPVPLRGAT